MKGKIRPLYSRLQGYLKEAPEIQTSAFNTMEAKPVCDVINSTIDLLNTISGENFSIHKFANEEINLTYDTPHISIATFRVKLGGLIAELHGKYFFDESAPFSGMPNMVVNQTNSQNQNVQIQMLLDIQSKINEELKKNPNEKEKSFLENLKSKLSRIKSNVEIISLLLNTAHTFGIDLEKLRKMFPF